MNPFSGTASNNGTIPLVSQAPEAEAKRPAESAAPTSEDSQRESGGRVVPLQPLAPLQPRRKIDLSTAVLPEPGLAATVESLEIRDLKGPGCPYTPNLEVQVPLPGLVYKPHGEYQDVHQIIAGHLLDDPRVMKRSRRIIFVPAFSWSTLEMVLVPYKCTRFGRRVLEDLRTVQPMFPNLKVWVEWDDLRRRHFVNYDELTQQEARMLASAKYPTFEQALDALSAYAFDNIKDLIAVNDEMRIVCSSKEVQ